MGFWALESLATRLCECDEDDSPPPAVTMEDGMDYVPTERHVVLGHDANVRELKGEGHPMFPAIEPEDLATLTRAIDHIVDALR